MSDDNYVVVVAWGEDLVVFGNVIGERVGVKGFIMFLIAWERTLLILSRNIRRRHNGIVENRDEEDACCILLQSVVSGLVNMARLRKMKG